MVLVEAWVNPSYFFLFFGIRAANPTSTLVVVVNLTLPTIIAYQLLRTGKHPLHACRLNIWSSARRSNVVLSSLLS